MFLVLLAVTPACFAQDQSSPNLTDYATPSVGSAPQLPGATNGTIGPPGGDATFISKRSEGLMVKRNVFEECPAAVFTVPVVALAVFLLVRRKRSSMWEMGTVASVILALSGIAWGVLMFH